MDDNTPRKSRSPRRQSGTPSPDPRRPLHPKEPEPRGEESAIASDHGAGERDLAALSLLCHLVLLCYFVYVQCYDASVEKGSFFDSATEGPGGRWKFITHINLCILLLYFLYSFITDVMTQWASVPLLKDIRDLVFTTVALPLSLFITTTFWTVFLYDRELIYPSVLDETIPFILCHHWHSFCAAAVLLELFLVYHRYPSDSVAIAIIANLWAAYASWIAYIFYRYELWVSVLLQVLSSSQLIGLFLATTFALMLFYFVGKHLTCSFWGDRNQHQKLFVHT